jgi:hypothetical protein
LVIDVIPITSRFNLWLTLFPEFQLWICKSQRYSYKYSALLYSRFCRTIVAADDLSNTMTSYHQTKTQHVDWLRMIHHSLELYNTKLFSTLLTNFEFLSQILIDQRTLVGFVDYSKSRMAYDVVATCALDRQCSVLNKGKYQIEILLHK